MKKSSLSSILILLLSSNRCPSRNTASSSPSIVCHAQQIDEAVFADISDIVMREEFPKHRTLADDDADSGSDSAAKTGDDAAAAEKPAEADGENKSDENAGGDTPPATDQS